MIEPPQTDSRNALSVSISSPCSWVVLDHLTQDPSIEHACIGLARHHDTPWGPLLNVVTVMLPEPRDYTHHSASLVQFTNHFVSTAWIAASAGDLAIVDLHTHTHPGTPRFSRTDTASFLDDGRFATRYLGPEAHRVMAVLGNDCRGFRAAVYDPRSDTMHQIDRLSLRHRPTRVFEHRPSPDDPMFDRHSAICGWDTAMLASVRIGVIGAGGTGSAVLDGLVSLGIGVGPTGGIVLIDRDSVEPSNRSRISGATATDVGRPKVDVLAEWAWRRCQRANVFPFTLRAQDEQAADAIAGVDLAIVCVDNDGARRASDELLGRLGIPFVDIGCDLESADGTVTGVGQVRVVVPGQSACLTCQGAYDASRAAIELDDELAELHASLGYGLSADGRPAPGVAVVNAMAAQHGLLAVLGLLDQPLGRRCDFLHFDTTATRLLPASTERVEHCPNCGDPTLRHGPELPWEMRADS